MDHRAALVLSLVLAAFLTLSGCTGSRHASESAPRTVPTVTGQADASTSSDSAAAPPLSGGEPEPAGSESATPGEPIHLAPARLATHVTLDSGGSIGQTGIFFLNSTTGKIDGWTFNIQTISGPQYVASPDNRWILAADPMLQQRPVYLVDRTAEKVYQLDSRQIQLLAGGGSHLLFHTADGFRLTGEDPAQGRRLSLAPASGLMTNYFPQMAPQWSYYRPDWPDAQALFAPDDRTLFLLNGRDLFLIQPDTGEATPLASFPAEMDGLPLANLVFDSVHADSGPVLTAYYRQESSGLTFSHILRFDWDGQKLADITLPHKGGLSPDGRLVWWQEPLTEFAPAVVLADASRLQPLVRLDDGSAETGWLADSSGLVVRTKAGFQVLRPDGTLESLPAFRGTWGLNEPVPAPDRADWFAIGGTALKTADGTLVTQAPTNARGLAPWGYTSDELRFGVYSILGKGYSDETFLLLPRVERPPFEQAPGMMVGLPEGDCLHLRSSFSVDAPIITCLAPGTRLAMATPPGQINKGWLGRVPNPATANGYWLYVRTEAGQMGWVALSGEYLTWAPAQPGGTPPDPVLTRISEEKANMAWWLSVALGEADCGALCTDSSFDTVMAGLYNRDRYDGGLAAQLRQLPGYDAARHDAALKPLEEAAQLIIQTWTMQGQPGLEPSAAWRQAATEARQMLEADGG